jgi:hypothetical protein
MGGCIKALMAEFTQARSGSVGEVARFSNLSVHDTVQA